MNLYVFFTCFFKASGFMFCYCQILSVIQVSHRGRELLGEVDNAIVGSSGFTDIIDLTEDLE